MSSSSVTNNWWCKPSILGSGHTDYWCRPDHSASSVLATECLGPVKSGISTTPTSSCDDKLLITQAGMISVLQKTFGWNLRSDAFATLVDSNSFFQRGPFFKTYYRSIFLVLEWSSNDRSASSELRSSFSGDLSSDGTLRRWSALGGF